MHCNLKKILAAHACSAGRTLYYIVSSVVGGGLFIFVVIIAVSLVMLCTTRRKQRTKRTLCKSYMHVHTVHKVCCTCVYISPIYCSIKVHMLQAYLTTSYLTTLSYIIIPVHASCAVGD